MSITNDYFGGQGKVTLRIRGSAGGFEWVGDADKFSLEISQKYDDIHESYSGSRQVAAHFVTETVSSIKMNLLSFSSANLKKFLYGSSTAITSGTATVEPLVAYLGAASFLANPKVSSVVLKKGAATLIAGTDYVLYPTSGKVEWMGSTLIDGDAVTAAYSYAASTKIDAFTSGPKQFEIVFEGVNLADTTESVVVRVFKATLDLPKSISFLDNKHSNLEISGMLLMDDTQPVGSSQFFSIVKS